jgi:hypothetical protein
MENYDISREEMFLQTSETIVSHSGIGEMSENIFGVSAAKMAAFGAVMGMLLEETRDGNCECKTCADVRKAIEMIESARD